MTTAEPTNSAAPPVLRGVLLYMAAAMLFACLDALGKYMTRDYHVVQIAWGRYVFHVAFLMILMPRYGVLRPLVSARPVFQLLRGGLLAGVTLLFFTAVSFLPLAEATAIGFVAPLMVTALAALVLKERVGPRRWTAVLLGFTGVLVVIRPGLGAVHWAAFIALAMATCNACYHLATRMLSGVDSAQTTIFYTGIVGAVLLSAAAPFFWTPLDVLGWVQMVTIGMLGGFAHYLFIQAYGCAAPAQLAPYSYIQIVWITILGYMVFGDFPDKWTIIGAAVIVASGLYVFYRESFLRRTRPPAAD
ncbi:MAG: DMT family transporter [Rhodospirillales bacterium]|nr:DMT family transporter [Rhodospirillales bacterium]